MTSTVPICIFWPRAECRTFWLELKLEKKLVRASPKPKLENYESVQHRLQFSGIKMGAKISFHRHFKRCVYTDRVCIVYFQSTTVRQVLLNLLPTSLMLNQNMTMTKLRWHSFNLTPLYEWRDFFSHITENRLKVAFYPLFVIIFPKCVTL